MGVLRGLDTPGDKSNGFWAMVGDAKGFEVDEEGSAEFCFFNVSIYENRFTAAVLATSENTKYDYVECSSQTQHRGGKKWCVAAPPTEDPPDNSASLSQFFSRKFEVCVPEIRSLN